MAKKEKIPADESLALQSEVAEPTPSVTSARPTIQAVISWEEARKSLENLKHCYAVVNGSEIRDCDALRFLGTAIHRNLYDQMIRKTRS